MAGEKNTGNQHIPNLKEKLLEQYKLHGGPVADHFVSEIQTQAEKFSKQLTNDVVSSLGENFGNNEKQKQYLKVQQDHFNKVFNAMIISRGEEVIDYINRNGVFNSESFQQQNTEEVTGKSISPEQQEELDREIKEMKNKQKSLHVLKEEIQRWKVTNKMLGEILNNEE